MNPDATQLDPTLLQLFNELIRAHAQLQRQQQRIVELEAELSKKNGMADKVVKEVLAR